MKIVIGSAQFGNSYGISNKIGKVLPSEVDKILNIARTYNIDTIDTAISYGNSESVLGNVGVSDFKIITKLPQLPENLADMQGWIEKQIEGSLNRLDKNSIHALLVHNSESLEGKAGQMLGLVLDRLKSSGIIKKIGVSIYNPSALEKIMQNANIDIVQAPFNIVDTCINSSGFLDILCKKGIEVHARSVFLQGLLLMDRNDIPKKFERWSKLWNYWHDNLNNYNLDSLTQCISFVNSFSRIDRMVIGVETADQLQQIIDAINLNVVAFDWSQMSSNDDLLINPSNWSRL